MYAKIQDHPNLVRDMTTQHILQTDTSLIRKHEAREKATNAARARDVELQQMKQDIGEIKEMLKRLTSPPPGSAGHSILSAPMTWPPVLGYDPRASFTSNSVPQFPNMCDGARG